MTPHHQHRRINAATILQIVSISMVCLAVFSIASLDDRASSVLSIFPSGLQIKTINDFLAQPGAVNELKEYTSAVEEEGEKIVNDFVVDFLTHIKSHCDDLKAYKATAAATTDNMADLNMLTPNCKLDAADPERYHACVKPVKLVLLEVASVLPQNAALESVRNTLQDWYDSQLSEAEKQRYLTNLQNIITAIEKCINELSSADFNSLSNQNVDSDLVNEYLTDVKKCNDSTERNKWITMSAKWFKPEYFRWLKGYVPIAWLDSCLAYAKSDVARVNEENVAAVVLQTFMAESIQIRKHRDENASFNTILQLLRAHSSDNEFVNPFDSGLSSLAIALIVIGCLVAVGLVLFAVWYYLCIYRKKVTHSDVSELSLVHPEDEILSDMILDTNL